MHAPPHTFFLSLIFFLLLNLNSDSFFHIFFRSTDVVNYLPEALQRGLIDNSSYVRKSAVMGVVKLFYADPNTVDGN